MVHILFQNRTEQLVSFAWARSQFHSLIVCIFSSLNYYMKCIVELHNPFVVCLCQNVPGRIRNMSDLKLKQFQNNASQCSFAVQCNDYTNLSALTWATWFLRRTSDFSKVFMAYKCWVSNFLTRATSPNAPTPITRICLKSDLSILARFRLKKLQMKNN